MPDPLSAVSAGASILTFVGASLKAVEIVYDTIKSYQSRDQTLSRLQNELGTLANTLTVLHEEVQAEPAESSIIKLFELLKSPLDHCRQVCKEFDDVIKTFAPPKDQKMRFIPWASMRFKRGDINDFIATIGEYKSTISVCLSLLTMKTTRLTQEMLDKYQDKVETLAYNLEMKIHLIDEKITALSSDQAVDDGSNLELQDEKTVAKRCLQICRDASASIEIFQAQHDLLRREGPPNESALESSFESRIVTQQALDDSRDAFAKTISHLSRQLDSMITADNPHREQERSRFLEDMDAAKGCLDLVKEVSNQASQQKIHIIGEVSADNHTDQVVSTTVADIFRVGSVRAKDNSAQLVATLTSSDFQLATKERYKSRPDMFDDSSKHIPIQTRDNVVIIDDNSNNAGVGHQESAVEAAKPSGPRRKPTSNEVRRRDPGDRQ